jgi:hypothetical protein
VRLFGGYQVPEKFELRFPIREIRDYAALYKYPGEPELIAGPVARARSRGWITHDEFLAIGRRKSQRPRKLQATNAPAFVEEITRVSLSPDTSARLAIEILTLLAGVAWPTASVILHFCHRERYPILDFRALWSVSIDVPNKYTYPVWMEYSEFTRTLARRAKVDMRTLDRALWQYSSMHQRGA